MPADRPVRPPSARESLPFKGARKIATAAVAVKTKRKKRNTQSARRKTIATSPTSTKKSPRERTGGALAAGGV
jgi:hypothetical protein